MRTRTKTISLFVVYVCLLVWGIVFKMDVEWSMQLASSPSERHLNLIPLAGTAVYDGYLDVVEIGLNILAFVPFGIWLELLRKEAEWESQLFIMAGVSLLFEGVQYAFYLGIADITDLLANTLDGAVGIVIAYLLSSIWREETEHRLQKLFLVAYGSILCYQIVAYL